MSIHGDWRFTLWACICMLLKTLTSIVSNIYFISFKVFAALTPELRRKNLQPPPLISYSNPANQSQDSWVEQSSSWVADLIS